MEVRYTKDVDPAKLNGHRIAFEASRKAAPEVIVEAYRMALAYGTPLVDEYEGRVIYLDPRKYSLEDIRSGAWKDDPTIYDRPALPL